MEFEKILPQAAGVSEKSLADFFRALDTLNADMHSVIMIRKNKLICEAYYEPIAKSDLHRMFSVTKSFVSLAVSCLAADGKIGLDDYIVSYFPEYPTQYEYIKNTTIRDMLMMRSPHDKTTYKADLNGNWVESFFTTKPTHRSGTVFAYDTSATHTLGALVEKISGMTLLDYLRVKFLDKTGFSRDAYCLKDPQGVSIGGSGLMARSMDIAKAAYLVMNGGKYDGKQLLDAEYLKKATSKLSPTIVRGSFTDEKQGYGMQFWRTRNNGFMMYGLGGQIALCLPDKKFILVTTADTQGCQGGLQDILDIFWNTIYNNLDNNTEKDSRIDGVLNHRRIQPFSGETKRFSAKFTFDENVMGITDLAVRTNENGGQISYTNQTGSHNLNFKTDDFYDAPFPYYGCRSITSGAWKDDALFIKSRLIGEMVGSVTMELYFSEKGVTVLSRKTEGTHFNEFNGVAEGTLSE